MAKRTEWTREEIGPLITEYESRPVLWDVQSTEFRDRQKKNDAWKNLAESVQKDIAEVQRKIHKLRNQFAQELKKVGQKKSGQGTEDNYTTIWSYFQALVFIKRGLLSRKTTCNLDTAQYGLKDDQQDSSQNTDDTHEEEQEVTVTATQDLSQASHKTIQKKSSPWKRKKNESPVDKAMEKACALLSKDDDEYDTFGAYVASELRSLSKESSRRKLKRMIQRAVLEISEDELKPSYASSTTSSYRSATCSPVLNFNTATDASSSRQLQNQDHSFSSQLYQQNW